MQYQVNSIKILGVRVDDVVEDEAAAIIADFVARGGPHQIVTVNPEFVMMARHNPEFGRVLAHADLATPDGYGLLLVARRRGTPLRARVTGVQLVQRRAAGRSFSSVRHRGWPSALRRH
jgi:N-acetylglucosaminyldiphosphoundecaprenol N-acetyl-beta-D-mannosaminyltransferase